MSRTFRQHIWIALFNKKKANAIAKIKEKLKAESQARAKAEKRLRAEIEARTSAERKVKAEAEKMLLTQHRRYSVLAERAEAQAKEGIAAAEAKAEEKIRSYAAALAQTEEKLTKAKEKAKTEAITRAKAAEESLLASPKAEAAAGKADSEERQRVEAKAKEAIAAAEAKAEEKIQSYAAALAQAEEKLTKAEEKARTEALTRAKAEESLLASAKAEAAAGKAKSKERQSLNAQPAETIKTFKRIRRHVFHPGAIKRKFTFLSALVILSTIALVILSAIAFTMSALNDPPVAEPGSVTTQEETPVPITLMGSDPDGEQLTYNVITGPSHGSLNGTAPNLTHTPNTNFYRSDSFTFKVNDGTADSIPATVSITVNPAPPKIAKLTILDGYNQRNRKTLSAEGKTNLVQSSDNKRWETSFGSYVSFDFSDVSIPADAAIKSVVVRVEHFEEERFTKGKLKWSIGTGWPTKPVVWATLNAPVHEEESHEAIDSWDVTGVVDTLENINSLQLQIKNNDNVAHRKTLIDYIYVLVEWD